MSNKQVVVTGKSFTEVCEKLKPYQNKGYRVPMGGVKFRGSIVSPRIKSAISTVHFEDGSSVIGRGISGTIAQIINGLVPMEKVKVGSMYKRKLDSMSIEVTLEFDEKTEILVPKVEPEKEPEKAVPKKRVTRKKPTKKEGE